MEQIVTKELSLDVARPNAGQMVIAKQFDIDSRYLKVTLKNEGINVAIAPSSQVMINAIRKDGSKKSFLGVVNEDGTATVPVAPWMLEEDGKVNCDVTIVDTAGRRLSSTLFLINVEISAFGSGDITDDPNYDILIQLLAEVSQSKEAELARVAAETDRVTSETARAEAETARIEAETARATAEGSRASAETERAAAEALRQEEYEKMVPATESANAAASSANAAAESANEVVDQIDTLLSQHADQPYETATGESLHIEDSAGGRAKRIEFCGNSRQNSTGGKNLLDNQQIIKRDTAETLSQTTQTGIKIRGWALEIYNNNYVVTNLKPGKVYYVKTVIKYIAGAGDGYTQQYANKRILLYSPVAGKPQVTLFDIQTNLTPGQSVTVSTSFTTPAAVNDPAAQYILAGYTERYQNAAGNPISATIELTDFIISETDAPYEPFSGGISSPNPLYPQRIETVGYKYIAANYFNVSKVVSRADDLLKNNGNGTLTVKSSTTTIAIQPGVPCKLSDLCPELQAGHTYTLTAKSTGEKQYIYLNTTKFVWYFNAARTIIADDLNSAVHFYANEDQTPATISKIQVVEGTYSAATIPPYQDYVSGCPDRVPVPIVGKLCGKNLFSGLIKGKMLSTSYGSEYTSATAATSDYILIDISKTFYLSGLLSTLYSFICAYDADKNYVGRTGSAAISTCAINNTTFAYNTTGIDASHIKYIRITQYEHSSTSGKINDIDSAKIQLEQGAAATAYEPHSARTFSIQLIAAPVTNLFDYTASTTTVNKGSFDAAGVYTGETNRNTGTPYIKFLSYLNGTQVGLYSYLAYNTGHLVLTINKGDTFDTIRVALNGDVAECDFRFRMPDTPGAYTLSLDLLSMTQNSCAISNIKLQKGSFEIGNAIELCKINGVPDKITLKDGLWGIDKYTHKDVFGNVNRKTATGVASTNNRYFYTALAQYSNMAVPTSVNLICTHYKTNGAAIDYTCYIASYGKYVYMYDNRFETVDEFNANLAAEYAAGHPVETYYLLNEPERIILCDEAQTALNALAAASFPAGTVNMLTSNDPAPVLELEYRQDLKAFVVKVINELQNVIIEMGGILNV